MFDYLDELTDSNILDKLPLSFHHDLSLIIKWIKIRSEGISDRIFLEGLDDHELRSIEKFSMIVLSTMMSNLTNDSIHDLIRDLIGVESAIEATIEYVISEQKI